MAETDYVSPGFIFGGNAEAPTLEELKRRRAIAAAIAAQKKGYPKTLGEGLTYLGESIGEAGLEWRERQAEAAFKKNQAALLGGAPQENGVPLERAVPVAPQVRGAPPAAAAPPPPALPGSAPRVPSTLTPAPAAPPPPAPPPPVAAAPPPAPPPAVAAAPDEEQPTVASAPDLPAPGVTSSDAPSRNALSPDGPSPEAIAALRAAMQAQQPQAAAAAPAPAPVQARPPGPQSSVRDNITTALMNPQPESNRAAPLEAPEVSAAAFAPPDQPPTDAPLKITVGGPAKMADRSLGAYLKPTTVPRGVENLDPRVQDYVSQVSKAYPGVQFTSGYRSPAVNAAVGGAQNSEHMRRLAVDMDVSGVPADQRGALIADARARGAGGIGNYGGNAIHVDFRTGQPVAWGPNRSYTSLNQTPQWFREQAVAHRAGLPVSPQVAAAPPPAQQSDPRVTTLAVRPSESMQERPPQAGDQQDALLQDITGGGARPGMRGATASLGRAGVMSDAAPLGSIGANDPSLGASIEARRNAIAGAINQQPQQAPAVPEPDPTLTAAQQPPASTSTSSEPPVRMAQAGAPSANDATIFNPRPVKTVPVTGQPDAAGIQKAPDQLPSQEPIVGRQDKQFPDIKPLREPPKPEEASPREKWLRGIQSSPYIEGPAAAAAAREYQELEQKRLKRDELRNADWQFERNQHFELQKAKREWELGEGERLRKEQKERQDIQIGRYPKPEDVDGKLIFDPATSTYTKPKIAGYDPNVAPSPKLNEDQRKTLIFYNWAAPAHELLKGKDKLFAEGAQQEVLGKVPFAGNKLLNDEYRLAKTAANNFVLAFMRSTSGAAYGAKEAEDHARGMLPKWGDDPKTAAFKAEERQRFVDSLHGSLGPAREIVDWHAQRRTVAGADKQSAINDEMKEVQPRGFGDVRVNKKTGAKRVWNGSIWMEE